MIKYIIVLLLLFYQTLCAQQQENRITWPPITKETKPWTRWWLPGSITTKEDITSALEKYRQAGLGGMELTVLYGVKGKEDKFVQYLSPQWMKMFEYTLGEAKKLDLGLDLANASSWPFGGQWVTEDYASKTVAYKTYDLKEGESLIEKIVCIQEPWIKWNGTYRADIKDIIDPIYKNKNLQELAIDQIKFEKPIPLQVVMAYSDKGQIIDLTKNVDNAGNLSWKASSGNWTLYAVFEGLHGKMVERAGPGGEGLVIDHFSDDAIQKYLSHFDDAFKGYDLKYLRGYFNDSYEVDDARGQSCWTPDFFEKFKSRRGYDLKENLPALFQKDDPEKNLRVLCDYRQTISDLILDNFTKGWTSWANKQGKITRNQAHGSPGNILDLYAATDIPETEGTEITRMKFGTSAANVTGKKYASAEAATWLGEHFSSTLFDVKKAVDQFFIAGVNHIFYHGTCFSPRNEPWPGFLFYAAVEFTPVNSFWNDFSILNSYVTRVQSFMQKAKPDNDILLWFPIFDRFSDYTNKLMLEHFDQISPRFNGSNFKSATEVMLSKGYSFDYISDLQISQILVDKNLLNTGGVSYQTLVLPECKYIPVETFNRIINLADKGATVIFYGKMPDDVSGWHDLQNNREMFQYLKEQLKFKTTGNNDIQEALFGKGKILMGSNLEQLLTHAKIRREPMADTGLRFVRRKNNNNYYFILNQTAKRFDGWVSLGVKGSSAAIFNPSDGDKGLAKIRQSAEGNAEIYLRLSPYQSAIVETFTGKVSGSTYIYPDPAGSPVELSGTWSLKFTEGGPVLPAPKDMEKLISWTELGDETYKDFSGTAEYSINLRRPTGKADGWILDLGKVCESARIILNGREIAGLIGPDFQIIITPDMLKEKNVLTIKISNLMANRIAYLDRNNVQWKKFYNTNFPSRLKQNNKNGLFDASTWLPRESGLIGPVTITAVKRRR